MQCISCNVEINPKWQHAIQNNICPFCGNNIIEEHLKNLLSVLRDTMEALQAYPQQLNDWLLSNYQFIKTDSPNLYIYVDKDLLKDLAKSESEKDFLERKEKSKKEIIKMKTDVGEEEVLVEKIQPEEKTSEFFKRAEAIKPRLDGFKSATEKTEHLKELKKRIEKAGSESITENGDIELISPEMLENADPSAVEEFKNIIDSHQEISDFEDDDIPGASVINTLVNMKGKNSQSDLLKLKNIHNKSILSRKNFNSGKGVFSR